MDKLDALFESASRGDEAALEDLLQRFLPDLRRYLQLNAGALVRAKESSSDLVQSVCREVLERIGTERLVYKGEGEFKQWLYNAALFKIRARQRFYLAAMRDAGRDASLPESAGGLAGEGDGYAARAGASPSEAAALNEEVERVRSALAQLPDNYRQVILLAHVEGLSHRDIAHRLEISEGNSRVLLSRALARLASLGLADV